MSRTYIIAEAGVNHNGDIKLAKQMIEVAKEAGVDAIKFQTFIAKNLVTVSAKKAEYQEKNTQTQGSQLEMLEKLELSFHDFIELNNYAKEKEIDFISTPFDEESLEFLVTLNMPFWKIPSGEITNLPYLLKIKDTNLPIILSTGMCTMEDIKEAMNVFWEYDKKNITILHCNTEYPTPFEDVNLKAMDHIKREFGCKVGYSDHTKGIEVPIAAVARGACVIEKHFTLDKTMEGPDHKASLEPEELKEMVRTIRNIEKALGNGIKEPSTSEIKNRNIARKSIVAKCDIKKGHVFTEQNLTVKRPGDGTSPMKWFEILSSVASKDYEKDQQIIL